MMTATGATVTEATQPNSTCASCTAPIPSHTSWLSLLWPTKKLRCEGCQGLLCKACHGKYPLLVVPPDKEVLVKNGTVQHYCKSCFRSKSTIDFDKDPVVISGTSPGAATFVYVHGGGGSRQMFFEHALEMNKRHGYGAVLLDLPGHGAKVDVPLTLDSCAEALRTTLEATGCLEKRKDDPQHNKLVYVGGSLGAYVGFYLLDQFRDSFDGAVLMDCGQNVGPGASLKAKLGLVMLKWVANKYSNADLMSMMVGVSKKSKADYKIVETCFGAGNFFEQGGAQVECLKGVAPADHLPHLTFPILFMNGGDDYRDSEQRWLKLCTNPKSELKTYAGGDHFFCHDTRFLDDIFDRMHDLAASKI